MHNQLQKYHTANYRMCVNHLRIVVIPYFDHPLRSTCEKYCRTVRIPSNVVNWGVMSHVSLKKFRAVFSCTFIDNPFVRTHQKHGFIIGVKCDTPSPTKSVIAKTKTRKDFATSDEETIPLCSPANTGGKHLKQH